jgi:biotin carboxylase
MFKEKPKFLSIGGGKEQLDGIKIARSLGLYVIAVDENPSCDAVQIADEFFCIDIKQSDRIIELAKEKKIAGIIPSPIGRYLTSVSKINDTLGLIGTNHKAALIATDKRKFYEFARAHKIRVPDQVEFEDKMILNFDYPVILKPRYGSGSRGIKVVFTDEEFLSSLDENKEYYKEGVLVERYIHGQVYGADIIIKNEVVDVVCIRSKLLTLLPYCVEYAFFSVNDEALKDELTGILNVIVKGLNIKNSLMHIDFIKNDEDKICVIELSPRPSGLMISSRLVPLVTGRNLIKEFLLFILGEKFQYQEYEIQSAALCYLAYFKGSFASINDKNDIEIVEFNYKKGKRNLVIKNMSDMIDTGYILYKGKNENICRQFFVDLIK